MKKMSKSKRQYISYTIFRILLVINFIIFFGSFSAFEYGYISTYQFIFQSLLLLFLCFLYIKLIVIFEPRKRGKIIEYKKGESIYKTQKN